MKVGDRFVYQQSQKSLGRCNPRYNGRQCTLLTDKFNWAKLYRVRFDDGMVCTALVDDLQPITKYKVGDRLVFKSHAGMSVPSRDGQTVEVVVVQPTGRGDSNYQCRFTDGQLLWVNELELSPVAATEPDDWQPGDRAYCEEPGHPAQGCLVEVKGPYEFDADRLTVYGLSGKTYHAAKQYLRRESSVPRQPAPPQPITCPCTNTKDPGHTIGYFGDRVQCYDCRGTLVLGSVSLEKTVDTTCRTWSLGDDETLQIGDNIAGMRGSQVEACATVTGFDEDGDPKVAYRWKAPRHGDESASWYRRAQGPCHLQRWNGVPPKEQDDTVCRTWPIAAGEKLAVGDLVSSASSSGVIYYGRVTEVQDGTGRDPFGDMITYKTTVQNADAIEYVHCYPKGICRWNGVAP